MDVVTSYGFPWSELFRLLGPTSLLVVLLAVMGIPIIGSIHQLLWISAFLAVFAISIADQLWSQRWIYPKAIVG